MAAQTRSTTAHLEKSMPIRLQCEDCGAKIKVPEGAEGRKIKCPKCGAILRAPGPEDADNFDETVQTGEETSLNSLAAAAGSEPVDDAPTPDMTDTQHDPDAYENEEFPEPSPPDLDRLAEHQEEGFEPEAGDGEDPLAALAAMSDGDEEAAVEEAFDEPEPADEDHPLNELFDQPTDEVDFTEPDERVSEPAAASPKVGIPLAKPKPKPQPTPQPDAKPITASGGRRRVQPVPKPQPVQSEPKAIPLSSQPASPRAQGVPIPLSTATVSEQVSAVGGQSPLLLLIAGWLLRVMAFLAVGGSAKLMLVAWDLKWSLGVCLLVLLAGLLASAITWGLAEIALALRHLLIRRR